MPPKREKVNGLKRGREPSLDGNQSARPQKSKRPVPDDSDGSDVDGSSDSNNFSQWNQGVVPEPPKGSVQPDDNDIPIGIVSRILCRNFMCHSSMEVDLNKRINFVVGRNGSGKSAILIALVVGLGGKASATSRGTSLKAFIKTGEKKAVVEVTLGNCGPGAFKPTVYGRRITVVRTLTQSQGTSNYKIKDENGRVVSTKREELSRIVACHNIQVDNPVSVLNQDLSRTFLNSSNPHDKFVLFMRATQLEDIEHLHEMAVEVRAQGDSSLLVKRQALAVHQASVAKLYKRWSLLKSVPEQKKKIEALENELAWAQATEKESLLAEAVKLQEVATAKMNRIQASLDSRLGEEEELKAKIKDLTERMAILQGEKKIVADKFEEAKQTYLRYKETYGFKDAEAKRLQGKINNQRRDEAFCVEEIRRLEQDHNGPEQAQRRAERKVQMVEQEARLQTARACLSTSEVHVSHLVGTEQPLKHGLAAVRNSIQDAERRAGRLRAKIKGLQSDTSSNASVFGAHMPALLAKIASADKSGAFARTPIGPLGAHVQVRDATWAGATEAYLGRTLSTFRCHCEADAVKLQKLAKEMGVEVTVIRGQFRDKLYDTSRDGISASGGHQSLLSMLVVPNVVVANTLVDQCKVERVLLLASQEEAYRTMSDHRLVPPNCGLGITKRGDQFYPDPNYRSYGGAGRAAKYLQANKEGFIRQLEDDLREAEAERARAVVEYRRQEEHLKQIRDELKTERDEQGRLRKEEQLASDELRKLREAEEVVGNQSVAVLEGDLLECRNALASLEATALELEGDRDAWKEKMLAQYEKTNLCKSDADEKQNKVRLCNDEMAAVGARQRSLKTDVALTRDEVGARKLRLDSCAAEVEKRRQVAEQSVDNATQLAPRINTRKSVALLEEEKNAAQTRLRSMENEQGSYVDVRQEYNELKVKVDHTASEINECQALLTFLSKTIKSRAKLYKQIRQCVTLQVIFYFKHRLNQRKYSGDIIVNHNEGTLVIQVSPASRGGESAESAKDTRTLSGGERSYSTVVFIMALWDSIVLPFYFMDEFDVFMDKANRRAIMDMLLEHARKQSGRQFVFLTPQDTSTVETDSMVTIHRMEDPRSA